MNLFEILLVVHILAVSVWIGGGLVGVLLGSRLRSTGETAPFASFCSAFATIGGPVFGGSSMLVVITGLWMVGDGYPQMSDPWVGIGLAGWLVSMLFGATVVGRAWHLIGRDLQSTDSTLADLQPRISRAVAFTYIDVALRALIVIDMVWRPT